ncbi:ParB/RepB/Spo0J family partition protein [Granulicella arctica]|uniref:ParB/RepB/Spo0J family partition protein n=1 Tax=Granulicella arctica TaxID=940613 RepID=UPI0021E03C49|nr:ParB/RepB/Spo0J family partition protein [Granulicella arctica]
MSNYENLKRRALGKGLESLLPPARVVAPPVVEAPTPVVAEQVTVWGKPLEIALTQIVPNPQQTRTQFDPVKLKELAASIKASGVVQPIVVKALPDGMYQLIMGERRWLASQEAGKATIPAIVREASDEQAMEMTIVENLQRADLNPMEQARAYQRLARDFQMTQEQMAVRTGKDRASVTNFLRLLRLPKGIQDKVESGELTFGHARALLALEDEPAIAAAAQKVIALSMSVRQTESYVQGLLNPELKDKDKKPAEVRDPNVRDAEDRLRRALGLKVQIEDKRGKGRVIIEYSGVADFDAILTALDGDAGE